MATEEIATRAAWAIENQARELADDLAGEIGRLVGIQVTERGTRALLHWLTPLLRHGLPLDAPPELRQAAGMAFTHLLASRGLRAFSRKELADLLAEAGLSLAPSIIFDLLRQMYWVARAPQFSGDCLLITDPVWTSVAALVGRHLPL